MSNQHQTESIQLTDEHHLIEQGKNGNDRAFRDLYDRHVDPLYRFMSQYSRDAVQVEDWVQRAFIKAFRGIQSYNGSARFSTWLFTIALNEMRSDLRRPSLVVFRSDEVALHTGAVDADDSFIWNGMMRDWLNELDESKRTVFLLYEVEGYSHAEIASILNIGESSSRTLLHRAKQYLKDKWETEEQSA